MDYGDFVSSGSPEIKPERNNSRVDRYADFMRHAPDSTDTASGGKSWLETAKLAGSFLLWACVIGVSYTQAPLYYSNQNQYFLHGLARANEGFLRDDWLAQTADPTPVFSLLVEVTVRHLPEWMFHVYYVFLQGVYWASLISVFSVLAGAQNTIRLRLAFAALLLLSHSAFLRWASYRVLGWDYPCYFQGWLAAQYVLGPVFQPSAFGVLLVLSVALLVHDRPFAAVSSAALGATVHSTYLLSAAFLTLAFMIALMRDGQRRQAVLLGAWSLLLVTPVVVYALVTFRPTNAETFAEANQALVHMRIPHHCIPRLWCNGITLGQVAWMLLSLYLIRGTRLFGILGLVFLLSAGLTLLQAATGSDELALLFPWRASVIVIPLATTVVVSHLVLAGASWFNRAWVGFASGAVVIGLFLAGGALIWFEQGFQTNDRELPLMKHVRENGAEGEVYLLPVDVPNLKATVRGSLSSDFKPLPAKKDDASLIPFDLQRFRLHARAAIFVDFKAIPYKDVDVLEWHRRVRWNQRVYKERDWNRAGTLRELKREGITHVIATKDRDITCDALVVIYEDADYRIYRVP
jgi:hypothetical protein